LAKELGVSDRTIRNEIKAILPECTGLGISIQSIRGKGYLLQVLDEAKFKSKMSQLKSKTKVEDSHNFSNQNDRVIYILKRLLLDKGPIKLESFEDEMFVSKSTIQHDLKLVKEMLLKYNLNIVNRPHYGTYVEGEEYMKRQCLSNYVSNRQTEVSMENVPLQLINQELQRFIKSLLIEKVNKYNIEISDISLENLAIHIAIACRRIEEGFIIEHFNVPFDEEYPFETIVAKEIVASVEDYTGLSFPHSEINYIIVHLLGTKLLRDEELTKFSEFDEAGNIVQCMLKRLKDELNWDFRNDHEFIQALTLHIRPAMNRLRYKMNIRNPLLKDIKVKYPSAFEGAVIASKCIGEYLSLEPGENEIAYIALHIALALERQKIKQKKIKRVIVVCASGVGSAKLLYYRLRELFENEIEIVDSINYYRLSKYDLTSIDLIISTLPIKEDLGIPVIVVNTFLGDEDIDHIRNHLHPESYAELHAYLHPNRVFLQKDLQDKASVIHFLCQELYKQGLVSQEYEQLVWEREEMAPTSFGNLFAIPHPITPTTTETFWTVCTLKHPIPWSNDQMVQFVCLLNIKRGPTGDLEKMYKTLINIITNKKIVQNIIKSQSVNEVIQWLQSK
jgi:lichenan operon transcriptional antiterminator